jgi:hypothetical protein
LEEAKPAAGILTKNIADSEVLNEVSQIEYTCRIPALDVVNRVQIRREHSGLRARPAAGGPSGTDPPASQVKEGWEGAEPAGSAWNQRKRRRRGTEGPKLFKGLGWSR